MDRRKFIVGMGAVAIAAPILAKTEPQHFMRTKTVSRAELAKRYPEITTLFVSSTQLLASQWRDWHGRPEEIMYIGAGAAICGRGFDTIIMDRGWDRNFPSKAMAKDYFNSTLFTRLHPGGKVYYV